MPAGADDWLHAELFVSAYADFTLQIAALSALPAADG